MLKVCICDDDLAECKKIENLLIAYSVRVNMEITIDTKTEPEQLLSGELLYDVIFLDIRFKQQDRGVDTGVQLRKLGYKGILIFVTTYPKFAIPGYRAEPFRYILKPYTEEEFFDHMDAAVNKLYGSDDKLTVKTPDGTVIVDINQLAYIEGAGRRRQLVVWDGNISKFNTYEVQTWSTLKELYELLPKDSFAYPQKGFIVNFKHVSKVHSRAVYIKNGLRIPLGRNYIRDFMLGLNRYLKKK